MAYNRMLQTILDNIVSVKNDIKRLEGKVDDGFRKVNDRLEKKFTSFCA